MASKIGGICETFKSGHAKVINYKLECDGSETRKRRSDRLI
jgi:hypothetical protein